MKVIATKLGEVVAEKELGETLSIGRSSSNDLVLSDPDVSRKHAQLTVEDGKIFLEDLSSFNGTLYQGTRVKRTEIEPGKFFQVGPFQVGVDIPVAAQSKVSEDPFLDAISVRAPDQPSEPRMEQPPVSSARLIRLDGKQAGQEIPLTNPEVSLGGAGDGDPKAAIVRSDRAFTLRDHQEQTNTFVDGVPVRERELENHDVIQVGMERFEYLEGDSRAQIELSGTHLDSEEKDPKSKTSNLFQFLSDWRLLVLGGVLTGLILLAVLPSENAPPPPIVVPPQPQVVTTPGVANTPAPPVQSETTRTILHNLKKTKQALKENKLDEADAHLKPILSSLDPGNKEARSLKKKLDGMRALERRNVTDKMKKHSEQEEKIAKLLEKGNDLIAAKKLSEARRAFSDVLKIDPKNQEAASTMKKIGQLESMKKRDAVTRTKTQGELKKKYNDGVKKFQAGQYGEAAPLLTEVASAPNPQQKSAKKLVAQIHQQTDTKLKTRVDKAKKLLEGGDVLEAHTELEKIVKQFPQRRDAADLFIRSEVKMLERAKKAYGEGIAAQQLAEDPAMALDKYQEVLKYSPDPKSEYHVKADKKIREIQLSK